MNSGLEDTACAVQPHCDVSETFAFHRLIDCLLS